MRMKAEMIIGNYNLDGLWTFPNLCWDMANVLRFGCKQWWLWWQLQEITVPDSSSQSCSGFQAVSHFPWLELTKGFFKCGTIYDNTWSSIQLNTEPSRNIFLWPSSSVLSLVSFFFANLASESNNVNKEARRHFSLLLSLIKVISSKSSLELILNLFQDLRKTQNSPFQPYGGVVMFSSHSCCRGYRNDRDANMQQVLRGTCEAKGM